MAHPTQLNATEQDTLVKQIGLSLLRAAPRDWRRVIAEYRAVGRYHELTGEVVTADGSTQEWVATHDIATLFGRLRAGMYREGRGTWFNARYQLDHPSSYNLEYDREEPKWDLAPPPQAYADELRMFPRSEENVPDWLMRRMAGLGPERPGPRFRMARIFDGAGPTGPVINRPELDVEEQDRLLDYLDGAPVVVPGRGYDIDRLASTPESTVPIAFHSDGTWIWPAAVNYYLREYGVAPEPDLVQHIRANGFSIPDVPDPVRQAAAAHINRGQTPPQPRTAPPPPPAPEQPPSESAAGPGAGLGAVGAAGAGGVTAAGAAAAAGDQPEPAARQAEPPFEEQFVNGAEQTQLTDPDGFDHADQAEEQPERDAFEHREYADDEADTTEYTRDEYEEHEAAQEQTTLAAPVPDLDSGPPTTITSPAPPTVTHHRVQEPSAGDQDLAEPLPARQHAESWQPAESQQPEEDHEAPAPAGFDEDDAGPPTQISAAPPVDPALDDLQDKLDELGVPESAYRLGEPAERGWSIERVAEGWRVGWYDAGLKSPAVFGDVADAKAFMLGKVLLAPNGVGEVPPGAEDRDRPHEPAQPPSAPAPPSRPLTATLSPEVATGVRQPREGAHAEGGPRDAGRETAGREAGPREAPPWDTSREGAPRPPAGPPREEPGAGRHVLGGAALGAAGASAAGAVPPRETPPGAPAGLPSRRDSRAAEEPREARQAAPGQQQQWPIQPLPGEPPLTLFRGKEMRTLPAGSELDRFGGPNGNLTYAAGTPFEERSLVPEWVNRPYHLYRVQRPLEVLAGVAIPWFNQPGGGAAYLLPASIEELVAEGDLIELEPGEPPVD
ncbi:glycohydrolase toxin TNT-related protein [Prauserella oleivorans]|uniref:Glycohydrolase toxin TNT-related protein n=1 Tax=Prauserella oleivorans TaxID=1478153 RepID=A0ABW5WD02_9PSEU